MEGPAGTDLSGDFAGTDCSVFGVAAGGLLTVILSMNLTSFLGAGAVVVTGFLASVRCNDLRAVQLLRSNRDNMAVTKTFNSALNVVISGAGCKYPAVAAGLQKYIESREKNHLYRTKSHPGNCHGANHLCARELGLLKLSYTDDNHKHTAVLSPFSGCPQLGSPSVNN